MFLSPNLDIGMVCENTCMSAEAYFSVNFSLRIFLSICNIHHPPSSPKNPKTKKPKPNNPSPKKSKHKNPKQTPN